MNDKGPTGTSIDRRENIGEGERGLPDFLFIRDRVLEQEFNLLLAGYILTDVPKDRPLNAQDRRIVQEFARNLEKHAEADPEFDGASACRIDADLADRTKPPFDSGLLLQRYANCISILVTFGDEQSAEHVASHLVEGALEDEAETGAQSSSTH